MRYPHIQQHDEKDCGAACLCMIAEYYGLKIPITKARALIKVDNIGANIYGLVDGASHLGLIGEGLSGDFNELKDEISGGAIQTPFIARILNDYGFEHFIVVWGFRKNKIHIGDPNFHRNTFMPIDVFKKQWLGQIVTFKKNKLFKKGNERNGSFKKFFRFVTNQKKLIIFVCSLSLLISAINVSGSFVFNYVVKEAQNTVVLEQSKNAMVKTENSSLANDGLSTDTRNHISEGVALNANSENFSQQTILTRGKLDDFMEKFASSLKSVCLIAIFLYLLKMLLEILRGKGLAYTSKLIELPLTMEYYNHLMELPAGFYGTRSTGEYMSRFNDTSFIKSAIGNATMTIVLDSLMAIAGGIFLCWISPTLFLITCITILIYIVVLIMFKRPLFDINHKIMEADSVVTSYLKETIDGIETIKSYNYMIPVKEKAKKLYDMRLSHGVKGNVTNTALGAIMSAVSSISIVILLWTGANLCLNGSIVLSDLIVFYYMLSYFMIPVGNLVNLQPTIQTAIVAAERINDILDAEAENNDKPAPNNLKGDIVLNKIDFCYGNRNMVLNNLSMLCKSGTKTAIVGESGCGKTTIAKLLLAFYEPFNGNITIGGVSINNYSPLKLRNRIAYISQTTFLFADTIMNNIKVGNMQATDEEVVEICHKCGIDEFVEKLPFGYNTIIEENGCNLSGGQRQRIAIARALIRKPDILIMDEATSNLDTVSESIIRDVIDSLSDNMTILIIAHRLKTVKNCDNIYVMENGRVIEQGTHNQLLSQNGLYSKLWEQ